MINVFRIRPRGLNIGNALIDLATSMMLREAFGDRVNLVPIPATAGGEEGTLAGLTARSIREMNLCGQGVVVGGGNLYENGRLEVDLHALRCLTPPLLLWSLSYGRIYDHRGRLCRRTDSMPDEVIMALQRQATVSSARDLATVAHLHDLGASSVLLAGCPTLLLNELPLNRAPRGAGAPGTLLSIRNPTLMSIPLARQIHVHDDIRRIAEMLTEEGLGPVRLLCHDRRDLSFAATFGDLDYLLPDDLWSYLELLRQATLVVSYRLHASIPCLSLATPVVNISYDERALSMMHTLGLADWDIDMVRVDDLVAAVADRVRRLADLTALRDASAPDWQRLGTRLRSSLEAFAEEVFAYSAGAVPAA